MYGSLSPSPERELTIVESPPKSAQSQAPAIPPPPGKTIPPPPPKKTQLQMTIIRKQQEPTIIDPEVNIQVAVHDTEDKPEPIADTVAQYLLKAEKRKQKRAREKLKRKKLYADKIRKDAHTDEDITLVPPTAEANLYVSERVAKLLRLLRHHAQRHRIRKRDRIGFWRTNGSDNVVDAIGKLATGKHQQIFFQFIQSLEKSNECKKKKLEKKALKRRIQLDFDGPRS